MNWNSITVEEEAGQSRLIQCLGHPPIKFINPRPQAGCCQVYASSYGGGLVDGDHIATVVECRKQSKLYLGTQSSTKVFKSAGRGGCVQETVGVIHAGALAVVCPDPVVPFAGSRYRQTQQWEVHADADLVLFDWLQPGRTACGEIFAYAGLHTELRVTRPGAGPIMLERFELDPLRRPLSDCGRFGGYQSYLNVYLIGSRCLQLVESLEPQILALNKIGQEARTADDQSSLLPPALWVGLGKRDGEGYVIRAMGGERRDIQPLHDLIFAALTDAAWLGFNPWDRRW